MNERRGQWMQSYVGLRIHPLDVRPEDVDIRDIAHSLSLQCRYNGHCKRFYCPTPDQRILTADLRWVPAGDLRVGDELFGFDETPHEAGATGKNRRRFRHATVRAFVPVKRPTYRLEMEDGSTVVSSAEHPWLVATKASRNQSWRTARSLAEALAAGRVRYMHRFFDVWAERTTRDAGWLAGMFDGEGHFSFTNRSGIQLAASQKPGPTFDAMCRAIEGFGFGLRTCSVGESGVMAASIAGGWREAAEFLGAIRPQRLLGKALSGLRSGAFAKQMDGKGDPLRIVKAWDEGEQWVSGIETSTHTYLCEGFGAHNSVAEHSVYLCWAARPEHKFTALMHDAAEAYLCDLPRALKKSISGYAEAEHQVEKAIAERFGYAFPFPPEIKDLDNRILLDERAQNMAPTSDDWAIDGAPLGVTLHCWPPEIAEKWFLHMFDICGGKK